MARIANIFARVVLELKEQAEGVLNQPDIPTSNAVGMFLDRLYYKEGYHLK